MPFQPNDLPTSHWGACQVIHIYDRYAILVSHSLFLSMIIWSFADPEISFPRITWSSAALERGKIRSELGSYEFCELGFSNTHSFVKEKQTATSVYVQSGHLEMTILH